MSCNRRRYGVAAIVATAALVVGACSNSTTDSQEPPTSPIGASSSVAGDQAKHNDVDVAFAQGMIAHHQQAIEMSDMLLAKQGIDPQIVSLAHQIKSAQGPEIEEMQGWLRDWDVASTAPAPTTTGMPGNMPGMPGMGGTGHGMMSGADMAALQSAQGAEAGRLFLTQMIEHHQGAIMMAQHEIHHGQFPASVEMARNIVTTQQDEISAMQKMLNG